MYFFFQFYIIFISDSLNLQHRNLAPKANLKWGFHCIKKLTCKYELAKIHRLWLRYFATGCCAWIALLPDQYLAFHHEHLQQKHVSVLHLTTNSMVYMNAQSGYHMLYETGMLDHLAHPLQET